ncbi:MAG: tRNA lysidine(34) synthetase TilS [Bacteroidota bacterium]
MTNDLLPRFLEFSRKNKLFTPNDRIIAGTSGGADSIAMLDLFVRIGQPVIVAHCNFSLRGDESDQDEIFVKNFASERNIPFKSILFQTIDYATNKHISIEMAARELRYEWFEKIREETGSTLIAIAHHADDSIETMLINLTRGTGLRGLAGIRPINGKIIRPMLFTGRTEISGYLESRQLTFREDSSNQDTSITRNRIRHHLLPEIEKINPGFRNMLLAEQAFYAEAQSLIERYMKSVRKDLIRQERELVKIKKKPITQSRQKELLLFEILRDYGFRGNQLDCILEALESDPGKTFTSHSHRLLIDREYLIIAPLSCLQQTDYYLDPSEPDSFHRAGFEMQILSELPFHPPVDPRVAWLDLDLLDFPLVSRYWKRGDRFYPLGMNQEKKISDFFVDNKIDRFEKSKVRIITSKGEIVWVAGHRIDHRFRITPKTVRVLEIRMC